VTTDQNWTSPPFGYEDGLVISNKCTLTIDGGFYEFNSAVDIEVKAGSHLILKNGAILTISALVNPKYWNGISAIGNFPLNQYKDHSKPNNNIKEGSAGDETAWAGELEPDQTSIEILAGCSILNAVTAIHSTLGAIVRARGASFLNCEKGIFLDKYVSNSHPEINASFAMDCKFIWDIKNNDLNNTGLIGIKLLVVRGVNIGGCTFTNSFSAQPYHDNRSIGIKVDHSTMHLSKSGNRWCDNDDGCPDNCFPSGTSSNKNYFNNLNEGVYIENSYYLPVGICSCDFNNCYEGIYALQCMGLVVHNCNFVCDATSMNNNIQNWITNNSTLKQLYCWNCHDFLIYKNTFSYDGNNVNYLYIVSSDDNRSRIRLNTISNTTPGKTLASNVKGIKIENYCDGLEVACNEFSDLGADIFIESGSSAYSTFRISGVDYDWILNPEHNGLINTFSAYISGRYNICVSGINIAANPIKYVYNTTASSIQIPHVVLFGDPNFAMNTSSPITNPLSCALTCSSLTKVKSYNLNTQFLVYPNPSLNGQIELKFTDYHRIKTIFVYDVLGRKVKDIQLDTPIASYKIENLDKGVYFICVLDKHNMSFTQKTISQ